MLRGRGCLYFWVYKLYFVLHGCWKIFENVQYLFSVSKSNVPHYIDLYCPSSRHKDEKTRSGSDLTIDRIMELHFYFVWIPNKLNHAIRYEMSAFFIVNKGSLQKKKKKCDKCHTLGWGG